MSPFFYFNNTSINLSLHFNLISLDKCVILCYNIIMKKGCIYLHRNRINGKYYIGQTIQKPERRFRTPAYRSSTAFYNALLKYGWDNFESAVLCTALDNKYLNELEEMFILQYNSLIPNGYNIIQMSEGSYTHSEETKQEISRKAKERYKSMTGPIIAPNRKEYKGGKKHCVMCDSWLVITSFGNNKRNWDGLNRHCKPCHIKQTKPYKSTSKLTKDELRESYSSRSKAISAGVARHIKNNPEYRKNIGKSNRKPVIAIHIETGDVIRFESGSKAREAGFTRVSQSISTGEPHKKYLWKFETITRNIYARKCQIKKIDTLVTERQFLDNNHRQKYIQSSVAYGLYLENEIVAIMTFGKPRFNKNYEWELIRFCSKSDARVIGGASKLLKHFERLHNPKSLISYANTEYSKGNVYYKLGFEFKGKSKPNYEYTNGSTTYSRYQCQKHKLHKMLDSFDNTLTEVQNMENNGFKKVELYSQLIFIKEY